jgi:hypothetical protein
MVLKGRYLIDVLKRRRIDIAVIIGWSIAIALLIIRTYQIFYAESIRLSFYKVAYLSYEGPTFTIPDQLLIAAVSFIAGIILTDIKSVIYGFFTTIFLSSALATAYVFNYIWFNLEYVRMLSHLAFGWEEAVFLAMVNVFRFVFPYGVLFSFLGITIGIFIRGLR